MRWHLSWRADPRGARVADRHYNRQSPGSRQFVPPGSPLVLVTAAADALWVTNRQLHVEHAWPGAWLNTTFRNEGPALSSELIREAVAASRWSFGAPGPHGIITFVDPTKIRSSNPGYCYLRAGFARLPERTQDRNLVVLQMRPDAMPDPEPPLGAELRLPLECDEAG